MIGYRGHKKLNVITMQSVKNGACPERVLELIVVWVIVVSALGMAATLAGHFLATQIILLATLITGLYAWRFKAGHSIAARAPSWGAMALLILVCLFFRVPAFNYVLGGQDEGVYVNMAHYIERTGGINVQDGPLEKLQGTPFVKRYLAENRHIRSYSGPLKGGDYVPGVYINSPTGSGLSFQFYHLFPVWMALFAGIFGAGFAVYALVFLSVLSVLFMYRLTLVLTDSPAAALVAGLLLALNPLHAFFSKFPVTEVPTLAFSLIGFTYLTLFWRAEPTSRRRLWLWLSMLSFGALFVTRISGFMYIPFFVALAMAAAAVDRDGIRSRSVQCWALGVTTLYALSVFYGLHWSSQYSRDIYRLSFQGIFAKHWQIGVVIVVVVGLLLWATVFVFAQTRRRDDLGRFLVAPARKLIGPIVLLGVAISIYKIYQLGWTGRYVGDSALDTVWGLAGGHWKAFQASSLAALFVYLGPVLPVAFLLVVVRRQAIPTYEFLRLFAAGFLVYILVLQWVVPYGPYYARYLLSEVVPYMLLLTVVVWARMPPGFVRRTFTFALAITLVYSTATTSAQLGKNESGGLYEALSQLLAPVDHSDVVLLDAGLPSSSEIKTPIKFTFGLPVVTVSKASVAQSAYIGALDAEYDGVFLISASAEPPRGFVYTKSTRIKVKAYEWNHSFPHKTFLRRNVDLYLYRLATPTLPLGYSLSFAGSGSLNNWLATGWSTPESDGVWSLGNHAELVIDPRQIPHVKEGLRLTFMIVALVSPVHSRQRVRVSINGTATTSFSVIYPQHDSQLSLDIPSGDLRSTRKLRIDFDLPDAITPKSIGINGDERVLGIKLKTLIASPMSAVQPSSAKTATIARSAHGKRLHTEN